MSNLYHHPEEHGLTVVADHDVDDAPYAFAIVVVYRDEAGRLLWGYDSGCSCPCPFEDMTVADLEVLTQDGYRNIKEIVGNGRGPIHDGKEFLRKVRRAMEGDDGTT